MTVDEFILKMADGIRAGTIRLVGGTASIVEDGYSTIDVTTLDAAPRTLPVLFTLSIDASYEQV